MTKERDYNINYLLIYSLSFLLLLIIIVGFIIGTKKRGDDILLKDRSNKQLNKINYDDDSEFAGIGGAFVPDNVATPFTTLDYYVKSGDSIHSISSKFGIDEVTIIKLNNIKIPSKITRGSCVKIPNQDGISVAVTKRNSIDRIAEKYNMSKEQLLIINNAESEDGIESVFVPGIHYDGISKQLLLGEYFRKPCYGRFTSYYGYRKDPWTKITSFHQGVDIANKKGTYIYAAAPGKVIYTGNVWPYGNLVKIQHTSGYISYYGHLNKFNVRKGEWVASGKIVGFMGSTGRSTGNHLHFEIRKYGATVNPMSITVF